MRAYIGIGLTGLVVDENGLSASSKTKYGTEVIGNDWWPLKCTEEYEA